MKSGRSPAEGFLACIDEAFNKRSWHGTTLRGSLRRVNAKDALWRPGEGRHNIWELALHAAYWKYVVRRRLLADRKVSFPLKGSDWIPSPSSAGEREWLEALAILDEQHNLLRSTISGLPAETWRKPKTEWMIRGVAAHDLYHTGQIQLIRKLL